MVDSLPWSALLETGIDAIDGEHHRLAELLNELARHYVHGEDPSLAAGIVAELSDYAICQFERAEAIRDGDLSQSFVESHLVKILIGICRDMTIQTLSLMREREDQLRRIKLQHRLHEHFEQRFRALVAEVSARFLSALSDHSFDQAMNQTLQELGELFEVDRTYLFLIHQDGVSWDNTHEWSAPGIEPEIDNLQRVPMDATPWWVDRLRLNRPVRIDRVAALPPEAAAERALLESQDILSVLALPTRDHSEQLTGFIGFDAVREERAWNEDQVKMLQVIADIVAAAHARKESARALDENRQDLLRAQQVARIGSWKYDLLGDRLEWSPETYRLFGVEEGTPMGMQGFMENVYAEDRDRVMAAWEAALDGAPYEVEHRTVQSRGEIWVREIAELRDWQQGRPGVAIGTIQDITEEKRHAEQLEALAFTDALTGLPNQHGFEQELEVRMRRIADSCPETRLFQIDIDGLGQINASMDMQAGDEILRTVGRRLSSLAGSDGHVGRLGGDQFVLALHKACGTDQIDEQAKALQDLISQPIQLGSDVIRVSACIGSVHNHANAIGQAGVLLRMADQAIYQAKLAGKNRHRAFDPGQYLSDRTRHDRLTEVRHALRAGQLRLHYQPKINLLTGKLLGLEALLRFDHPERGLLGPEEIIPHIEDHPLMMDAGDWIIDTALQQLLNWQQLGLDTVVGINVASSQLEHPDFVERLAERLRSTPAIRPDQIELEIVETGPMLDLATAAKTFRLLRGLGVMISLDDFGTGHASLQSLSMLAPHNLKIDQSFVHDLLHDPASRSIVQAIVNLSGPFKLNVIAEGLDTPEHAEALLQLGCRHAQGYAIARPMPPEAVLDWLRHWREQTPSWIGNDAAFARPRRP